MAAESLNVFVQFLNVPALFIQTLTLCFGARESSNVACPNCFKKLRHHRMCIPLFMDRGHRCLNMANLFRCMSLMDASQRKPTRGNQPFNLRIIAP